MKKLTVISLISLLGTVLLLTQSCTKIIPNGDIVREERNVGGFSQVKNTFSADVYFTQDSVSNVTIEASENIMRYIIVESNGEELTLKNKNGVHFSTSNVRIYISNPQLSQIHNTGSGNIMVTNTLSGNSLDIKSTGSGDLKINSLDITDMDLNNTGSGKIYIYDGQCVSQNITLTGSGDYNAENLRSENATIKLTGSGQAKVWATNNLNVTISGSGGVKYKGTPAVDVDISGSGDVKKL